MWNLLRTLHRKLGIKYRFDQGRRYVRKFGVRDAIATHRRIWSQAGLTEVRVPGLAHPIAVRPGTADASTLEKIFVWDEYDLEYPAGVRTILDAGANTGLSAVWFAARFPGAAIIAVEPQGENFELLRRNTAPYPAIVPVHAALWSEDTRLGLSNPHDRVDSYRYSPSTSEQTVPAFTVGSLMQRFAIERLDVLKIDIEGAEREVFAASAEWIGRLRMLIVELHGDQAQAAFTAATARLKARRYHRGENEIVVVDE